MKKNLDIVKRVFCFNDIVILAVILAVGLAFLFMGRIWLGVGITLLLCWLCMLPFFRNGYRIEGKQGLFKLKEIYASCGSKAAILAYLDGSSGTLEYNTKLGSGAIVEVYTSRDGTILARYWDYADENAGIYYDLYPISRDQKEHLEQIEPKS